MNLQITFNLGDIHALCGTLPEDHAASKQKRFVCFQSTAIKLEEPLATARVATADDACTTRALSNKAQYFDLGSQMELAILVSLVHISFLYWNYKQL